MSKNIFGRFLNLTCWSVETVVSIWELQPVKHLMRMFRVMSQAGKLPDYDMKNMKRVAERFDISATLLFIFLYPFQVVDQLLVYLFEWKLIYD